MKFQIVVDGYICIAKDSKGNTYGFTQTEEAAKDRVASLAEVGIVAVYEPIGPSHWVNDWIG